jgi:hypothetical protein
MYFKFVSDIKVKLIWLGWIHKFEFKIMLIYTNQNKKWLI